MGSGLLWPRQAVSPAYHVSVSFIVRRRAARLSKWSLQRRPCRKNKHSAGDDLPRCSLWPLGMASTGPRTDGLSPPDSRAGRDVSGDTTETQETPAETRRRRRRHGDVSGDTETPARRRRRRRRRKRRRRKRGRGRETPGRESRWPRAAQMNKMPGTCREDGVRENTALSC